MRKVRSCVEVIQELDDTVNIQIRFFSIIQRTDKDFSNEINETNIKLTDTIVLAKSLFLLIMITKINLARTIVNFALIRRGLNDLLRIFCDLEIIFDMLQHAP